MRTAGCALYLLKWHRDIFESFKESIRMGGDVDSLAAIVVGILGMHIGSEGEENSSNIDNWCPQQLAVMASKVCRNGSSRR